MFIRTRIGAVSLVLVLAGCSANTQGTNTDPPATTTSVPTAGSIPLGTYVKVDSREALVASGVDERLIEDLFGAGEQFRYSLKLDGTRWSHFFSVDGSPDELGDLGTYAYDQGLWVTTSESEDASGAVIAFEWDFDGEALTIQVDWDHSSAAPKEQRESDSMVLNGTYEKTG